MREPAQRLGCFTGIGAGIVESWHDGLQGLSAADTEEVSLGYP